MNREDIIRMATESQLIYDEQCTTPWVEDVNLTPFLERFANLVASAERERILEICKEGLWDAEGIRYHLDTQARGQA